MTALNDTTLGGLEIPTPTYDRSRLRPGIVHLGVGGFHRAHQAMYVDRLLNSGDPGALDWGICGVGVLPHDARMRDVLNAQDGLYTLVLKDSDGSWKPRVIGSIVDFLLAPDDPEAVIERMAAESTKIVSLTVTEGGYNVHPVTGEFDADNSAVVADLAPGATPRTSFGLVVEALARRRARGLAPFTVMSCDNIQGNGHVAAKMFGAFAGLRDPELGDWLAANVRFPNSMVDRITPVTTDADRAAVADRFGIDDGWPVVCEPFTQWVLEDTFEPRTAGVRERRGAGGRRRDAVRADEAPAAEREPSGAVLLRLSGGLPPGARGRPGSVVRGLPARVHGTRGRARPWRRCRASTWTRTATS